GLTAYRAVVTRANVQAGEKVLVTGIGGGVATFALQIAGSRGAQVFVTSGSDEKLARARELGATGGVNYHSADWGKEIVALTGGGPDVVGDSFGGDAFNNAIEIFKPGGGIVRHERVYRDSEAGRKACDIWGYDRCGEQNGDQTHLLEATQSVWLDHGY